MENIDIDIDIDKDILENIDIDIDIDKEILENIDIDKISNRLEFGISNRANPGERDEEVEENDEDDHDHLVEFAGRLGSGMRCFQRQVHATDRKVQETRWKTTTSPKSPRKKRRRKK